MRELELKIKEVIVQKDEQLNDIKRFNSVSDEYKKMVEAGLTSPRGYNLMTINDNRIIKYDINH